MSWKPCWFNSCSVGIWRSPKPGARAELRSPFPRFEPTNGGSWERNGCKWRFLVTSPGCRGCFPRFLQGTHSAVALQGWFPALEGLCLKKKSWFVRTLRNFSSPNSTSRNVVEDTGSTRRVEFPFFPQDYTSKQGKKTVPGILLWCFMCQTWLFQVFPAWWQRKVTKVQPLLNKVFFGEGNLGDFCRVRNSGELGCPGRGTVRLGPGPAPSREWPLLSESVPLLIRTNSVIGSVQQNHFPLALLSNNRILVGPAKLITPNSSVTI